MLLNEGGEKPAGICVSGDLLIMVGRSPFFILYRKNSTLIVALV